VSSLVGDFFLLPGRCGSWDEEVLEAIEDAAHEETLSPVEFYLVLPSTVREVLAEADTNAPLFEEDGELKFLGVVVHLLLHDLSERRSSRPHRIADCFALSTHCR